MNILFAGGGTGGHLFPALTIANEIKRLDGDCSIHFIGTKYGIENKLKDSFAYPISMIAIRGLPRKLSLGLLMFPFRLVYAIIQSLGVCRRFQPDIVVGTGGYVAGPPIIAASIKNIPCVIQEQNSYPGLVTKKLASKTKMVFIAYKKIEEYLPPHINRALLGNPINRDIASGNRDEACRKFKLDPNRKTILILGGSQGAHRINEAIIRGLNYLDNSVQLLWQCGERDYKDVAERLDKKDVVLSLFPFSNEMNLVYAAADIAIARAGALTIAELTACGIPSILIPYPHAAADHQTYNAREIASAGAAKIIKDSEMDKANPLEKAMSIINSAKLPDMGKASKNLSRPLASTEIAREILSIAKSKGEKLDTKRRS